MKRILAILLLIPAMALTEESGRYIILLVSTKASTNDVAAINEKQANMTGGTELNTNNIPQLPHWRLVANTNKVAWSLCFDKELPGTGRPPRSVTKASAEAWIATHISNTNHVRVYRSDDPNQVLIDAGLERVPEE